jgi:hypothetical protein
VISQPYSGTALEPLGSFRIALEDAWGNLEAGTSEGTVSAALENPTTGASLGGSLTKPVVNGIATFDDLTVDRSAQPVQLTFTQGSFAATNLMFFVQAWRMVGPDGGPVEHLVAREGPNPVAYASKGRSLFVFTDLGQSWRRREVRYGSVVTALWPDVRVGAATYDLAVGTEDGRVLLGKPSYPFWDEPPGLSGAPVYDVSALPSGGVIAVTSAGVFLDDGSGWAAKNAGLTDLDVRSV